MKWTTKARVHRLTSALPQGNRINGFFQQHVTHSYPRSDERLAAVVGRAQRHAAALQRAGLRLSESTLFEFGAGWDLAVPLSFAALGVRRQIVVDLHANQRPRLVEDVAARLVASPERFGLPRPDASLPVAGSAMLSARGIDYRAPCDARRTGLRSASVDAVTSTSTLEHIPVGEIGAILAEAFRILRPGGLASFQIDYSDHYAHGDRSLSPYNFLRFTDREWHRYNPSLHYQNRLRHSDHRALIDGAGFELLEVEERGGGEVDLARLRDIPLAEGFRDRDPSDLAVMHGWFLARRP